MSALLRRLREEGGLLGVDHELLAAERLQGHASSRRFFRVATGHGSRILVLYPPDQTEELDRYESTAAWFRAAGVRVPRICARGARALLVQDGGGNMLDGVSPSGRAHARLYRQAARIVLQVEAHGRRQPSPNRDWALDADRMRRELEFFECHTMRGWLGKSASAEARGRRFDELAAACAALPPVACHRDFHARNLLVANDRIMVLDFQDVMPGPVFYDVASLLWDNYCTVPVAVQSEVLSRYWYGAARRPLDTPEWPDAAGPRGLPLCARPAFNLVVLQRSLKALGTFGYQVTVAGNAEYGRLARRTWGHARRALRWLGWTELERELGDLERLPA